MLVITNGRVLVDPAMNEENMALFIENLKENIENLFGEQMEFEKVEKPFLMYKIPEDIEWKKFMDCVPSESRIEVMGIGREDEVTMPYPIHKNVKHVYSIEELKDIADRMCEILSEISKLESEKKAIAKRLGDQISTLNDQLKEEADEHRVGYKMDDKKVFVIMNFKEQMKYFHLVSNGELVHSEQMTEKDQRTLFDIKGYDPENFKEEDLSGFEIGIPDEIVEDIESIDEQSDAASDFIDENQSEANEANESIKDEATSMEDA